MSFDDQLGFGFTEAPAARRIWRVGDLVSAVRATVERGHTDIWVEGEISNLRVADSGHMYFVLKDGNALLRVVMFRMQARLLRFKPGDGMQVIARGRVTIYEQRGELQLSAEFLEPLGAGALQLAFEQLKDRLAQEGLFEAARKRALPQLPRRIGIVTSTRGAALQDMLNVLGRRHESIGILIYPAQVQGDAAAAEVAAGVNWFSQAKSSKAGNVDVVIIARGGGSIEDLAAFNDEGLARAIAASEIPVISAVGHETDFTIADFVADLRAATPSAAAEMVVESKHQLAEHLAHLHQRLARAARFHVLSAKQQLSELSQHGAFARIQDVISRRAQRLDDLVYRLAASYREQLTSCHRRLDVASTRILHFDFRQSLVQNRSRLEAAGEALLRALRALTAKRYGRLDQLAVQLDALSPVKILERGYALVFDGRGELLKDVSQVAPGETIAVRAARGSLSAQVVRTDKDQK
ncbi:MAG TPA: exodeoxyribonuclease VII large subunit [Candidatus Saccharimonadales bacterium]|jgi:exodeoxyribonuclease VII large subunit|nr:exodeoxyribonuclease VII large subunit [Candidatus Saccharimonadales bacterium]